MSDGYTVQVSREDGFWVGSVQLPWTVMGLVDYQAATETRRLADLPAEVRDLVAGYTDVDPDEVLLRWDYSEALGQDGTDAVQRLVAARAEAELRRTSYEGAQREAVLHLRARDISLRDTAILTGISFQRVQQVEARSA